MGRFRTCGDRGGEPLSPTRWKDDTAGSHAHFWREARDAIEQTPLINAVVTGQPAVVDALLRAGADPNHASKGGVTALMIAAKEGRGEIVRTLLQGGADPNATTQRGYTAYHAAKDEGHAQIARMIGEAQRGSTAGRRGEARNVRFFTPR
jgi:ankyrin repeat protein